MSKGVHDIFALVINFLGIDSQHKHVTINVFEIVETTRQRLVRNLTNY